MAEKTSICAQVSEKIVKEIDEIVEKGQYISRSDFVRRAVLEKLEVRKDD